MKPFILPVLIYYLGILLLPFFKGKARKPFLIAIPSLALINTILIRPQTSWVFELFSFRLVFMQADRLSLFVAYIFAFIGLLGILYSLHETNARHMFAYLYIGSSLGAVFAGDFLSLYLFWEIMAVAPTFLVWLNRDEESVKAGARYLIMHAIGGLVLLAGILLQFKATGSLAITTIGGGPQYLLILLGIGVNAAFIPIHTWLPDTYPRAHFTASVFLCVYTTKTAVYMLARTFPGELVVGYIGAIMALYGVSYAILQSRARKLLSYHVISQVGYMVASVGIGGAIGLNGGLGHLLNHILYKALLFMCIGSVVYITGKEDLTELGGLARKMPVTTICCIIAALSISGVPGFNGYISKSLMLSAAHKYQLILLMLEVAAVGTFLSFCKFIYFGFLRSNPEIEAQEPPLHMRVAMIITAAFCVGIGIIPGMLTAILPYDMGEFHFYSLGHTFSTIMLLGTALLIFKLVTKAYSPHKRLVADFDYFYYKLGQLFVWICQQPASRFGDMVDWFIYDFLHLKLAYAFLWFCRNPVCVIGDLVDQVVSWFMINLWLPITDSRSATHTLDERIVSPYLTLKEPWADPVARSYLAACELAKEVDVLAVDGVVNGVATGVGEVGRQSRRLQTGLLQQYAFSIALALFGLIALCIYYLK